MTGLIFVGVCLFSVGVVFSLITLPVEWDASKRAQIAMDEAGMLSPEENRHASKVLNAAFLTYLAAALTSLLTLAYYTISESKYRMPNFPERNHGGTN